MEVAGTAANDGVNIEPGPVPQGPMVHTSSLTSHYPSL